MPTRGDALPRMHLQPRLQPQPGRLLIRKRGVLGSWVGSVGQGIIWLCGQGGRLKGGGRFGGRKPVEYIYDGLYIITSARMAAGKDGFNICRRATHCLCV